MGAWVFERILNLLAQGSRADSRWVFVVLGLILSPVFLRAGLTANEMTVGNTIGLHGPDGYNKTGGLKLNNNGLDHSEQLAAVDGHMSITDWLTLMESKYNTNNKVP